MFNQPILGFRDVLRNPSDPSTLSEALALFESQFHSTRESMHFSGRKNESPESRSGLRIFVGFQWIPRRSHVDFIGP